MLIIAKIYHIINLAFFCLFLAIINIKKLILFIIIYYINIILSAYLDNEITSAILTLAKNINLIGKKLSQLLFYHLK